MFHNYYEKYFIDASMSNFWTCFVLCHFCGSNGSKVTVLPIQALHKTSVSAPLMIGKDKLSLISAYIGQIENQFESN